MKKVNAITVDQATEPATEATVHPLKKSYMFVSSKHVDYENITAFEAVTMASALFLAVASGVLFAS